MNYLEEGKDKAREVAGAKMRGSENIDGQEMQGDAREEWREEK